MKHTCFSSEECYACGKIHEHAMLVDMPENDIVSLNEALVQERAEYIKYMGNEEAHNNHDRMVRLGNLSRERSGDQGYKSNNQM